MKERFEYKYKMWFSKVIMSKIVLIAFSFVGIGFTTGTLYELIVKKVSPSEDIILRGIFLLFIVFFVFVNTSIMINLYPKMKITDTGLRLQMIFFSPRWVLIPWAEIKSIATSFKTFHTHELWEIKMKKDFPRWKKYLMMSIDDESGPAILISSDLERKSNFLDLLSKYVDCEGLRD